MSGLFCMTARNNTLNNAPLYSYGIRFLSVDLTWGSPGFFGGGCFEICHVMFCVCAHRHSHGAVYYWDMNLWSLYPLRTASSMREDGTSKASAVRWHQGLIICFTLSRYFIAQIAIWTRDDITHHQHRENWSERCWAVHWSLHHSQCKG